MADIARRRLLLGSGLAIGAGMALQSACGGGMRPRDDSAAGSPPRDHSAARVRPDDPWEAVRAEFRLDRAWMHFAGFLLASHPTIVRDALAEHRRGLDANPIHYYRDNRRKFETAAYRAAEAFIGAREGEVALTDSTTMGLGLLYGGFQLRDGHEVVTTEHDHYATHEALRLRAQRGGARLRKVSLYARGHAPTADQVVARLLAAVTPRTRIIAVTWVHSSSGVKLPLRAISDALAHANRGRDERDRALLCVDGVHGFGVDIADVSQLGCDFFVAGCHKWLCGPRGTGIVFGRAHLWEHVIPTIPAFRGPLFSSWRQGVPPTGVPGGYAGTPGGYHAFEHRWALTQAFEFQRSIGRARIAARIHALNRQLKHELARMRHVTLYTPMSDDLSAGITCFDVAGFRPKQVVARLHEQRIIASSSPYRAPCVRLAPGLLNTPEEVDAALRAVRALA